MLKKLRPFRFALVIFLITTLLMNYVFINAYIPTSSMENTIMTGDRVFGLRLVKDYERGDIVVFPDPDEGGIYLIKRIIGTPGDTIIIKNGSVFVNDVKLDEPYIKEPMRTDEVFSIVVPENGYFMMGDNRNDSFDARYWDNKIVYKEDITGKALFRYWPFTSIGMMN